MVASSWNIFKQALGLMANHFGKVLLLIVGQVVVLVLAQTVVLPSIPENSDSLLTAGFVPTIAMALIVFLYNTFFALFMIRVFREEKKPGETSMFSSWFWKTWLSLALLFFVLFIAIGLASLLLVIPAVVLAVYLVFSSYEMVTEDTKLIHSIKRSYQLVEGNWWYVFRRVLFLINFALFLSFVRLIPGPGATAFVLLSFFFSPAAMLYLGLVHAEMRGVERRPQKKAMLRQGGFTKFLLILWAIVGFSLLALFSAMGDYVVQVYAMYNPSGAIPLISAFGF